jgi:predicted ATPase
VRDSRFLTRVVLQNYKSIASCDVNLRPLTFLVGPNGAGKSNFLDALRFIADALRTSLDHALRDRGGINEVRRRSGGHPTHFGMRLEFRLHSGVLGYYEFRIGALKNGRYEVQNETCEVGGPGDKSPVAFFRVSSGEVVDLGPHNGPPAVSDRLYLVNAAGLPAFRPVYQALSHMGFYNLNPDEIRAPQSPDPGQLLDRDGRNIASVLAQMDVHDESAKKRIEEYLAQAVPGVTGVDTKVIGPLLTLEFRQSVRGSRHPWRFTATNMSDGTLRALGILVALFQSSPEPESAPPLIGIEEPEVALHPFAAGVLRDSLREASRHRQVIVTSHSPDLLDDQIDEDALLSVVADDGVTRIGPVGEADRTALRQHLYTAGELLRLHQLEPDTANTKAAASSRATLLGRETA